jgi:lipid-A-disaccharide synthase
LSKYYIIAGEASGDLHGANLIKEIKKLDSNAAFRCWGGDLMEEEGVELVKHFRDLAFMGFLEVIKNIRTIFKNIKFCKKDILDYNPDAVIFIDYPGFNLRIAEFVHQNKIPTLYYVSPQVWAWKSSRVKKIKVVVDKMYVILPFEKDFYKKFDYDVSFVGHPLIDAIGQFKEKAMSKQVFCEKYGLNEKPIIALLPGSRSQEIEKKLPIMLSVVSKYKEYQFVIAGAPSRSNAYYAPFLAQENVHVVVNDTYNLLNTSHAALVTSGTATLETALFKVPQVVCYKSSAFSYRIAKLLIGKRIKFISLVNLIIGEEIVKELIQSELTEINLIKELGLIVSNEGRENMLKEYKLLEDICGGTGASFNTANGMLKTLEELKRSKS